MSRRGIAIVLAGPSGVGKSTIAERILAADPGIQRSISATNRAPRPGEIDGLHYKFMSQQAFDALVATGGMLEHATVFGHSYGIPRAPVIAALEQGIDLVFGIDWQGHRTLKRELPGDVLGIFIRPPSIIDLERRLLHRGDTTDQMRSRMATAQSEMAHASEFDCKVTNTDLAAAIREVRAIIGAAREARS
jgi:guanylate kinase